MSFPFIALPSPWYQESNKISAPKCNPIFSAVPQGQNSLVSSINANKLGIRQWQIDEVVTPWDTSLFSVLIMGRIKLSRGFIWLWKCPHLRTPPHVFLPRRIRPCLLCELFDWTPSQTCKLFFQSCAFWGACTDAWTNNDPLWSGLIVLWPKGKTTHEKMKKIPKHITSGRWNTHLLLNAPALILHFATVSIITAKLSSAGLIIWTLWTEVCLLAKTNPPWLYFVQ